MLPGHCWNSSQFWPIPPACQGDYPPGSSQPFLASSALLPGELAIHLSDEEVLCRLLENSAGKVFPHCQWTQRITLWNEYLNSFLAVPFRRLAACPKGILIDLPKPRYLLCLSICKNWWSCDAKTFTIIFLLVESENISLYNSAAFLVLFSFWLRNGYLISIFFSTFLFKARHNLCLARVLTAAAILAEIL